MLFVLLVYNKNVAFTIFDITVKQLCSGQLLQHSQSFVRLNPFSTQQLLSTKSFNDTQTNISFWYLQVRGYTRFAPTMFVTNNETKMD